MNLSISLKFLSNNTLIFLKLFSNIPEILFKQFSSSPETTYFRYSSNSFVISLELVFNYPRSSPFKYISISFSILLKFRSTQLNYLQRFFKFQLNSFQHLLGIKILLSICCNKVIGIYSRKKEKVERQMKLNIDQTNSQENPSNKTKQPLYISFLNILQISSKFLSNYSLFQNFAHSLSSFQASFQYSLKYSSIFFTNYSLPRHKRTVFSFCCCYHSTNARGRICERI